MSAAPFALPPEPVHLHEVRWFKADWDGREASVRECRAVFHVHTAWEALSWSADYCGGSRGKDFDAEWENFDGYNGYRPSGRTVGWSTIVDRGEWTACYATRAEAVEHCRRVSVHMIATLERRIAALRDGLESLR